jgi:hypothetical protein
LGLAYAKGRRQEVLPLLQEFVGLENLAAAGKPYDVVEEMWPSDRPTWKNQKIATEHFHRRRRGQNFQFLLLYS